MNYLFKIIFVLYLACQCRPIGDKLVITTDYIINPKWDQVDNSIQIVRMIPKGSDSVIDINKITQAELSEKLTEDSTFSFTANVKFDGTNYSSRRVYYNKYNGFLWYSEIGRVETEIVGKLRNKTWYALGGLSKLRSTYYMYIDSNDQAHIHRADALNW